MLWMVMAPTINLMTALGGIPSVSSRMNEGLRASVVGRLRCRDAADVAFARRRTGFGPAPFSCQADTARNDASSAPPPGRMPSSEPSSVPRVMAPAESLEVPVPSVAACRPSP